MVLVLRVHGGSSVILDQDDWPVAVPFNQFPRVVERLRELACKAGVPVFSIVHCNVDPSSFAHTAAVRDLTTATLDMVAGTGTLQVLTSLA